jgi:hypothetical protein
MQDLDDRPPYEGYLDGKFNTSFRYELTDKTGKKVASAGLSDLDICLQYTLAFVPEIESVKYQNHLVSLQAPDVERVEGEVQFLSVTAAGAEALADPEIYEIAVLIFMSDLLYEIYLAKPETLKSDAPVKVKDVLDCSDMQEFISRYAKSKLKKLQRGSVKGFIADNKQIKSLGVFDTKREAEIEKILQIRHVYAHQNGIIDEKFRESFPAAKLNDEYRMTLDEFLERFEYLAQAIDAVDEAARKDYQLASFS